jgi:hypothetical protein
MPPSYRGQRKNPRFSLSTFVCISWRKLDEEEMLEGVTLYSMFDNEANIHVHNSPMVSLHKSATFLKWATTCPDYLTTCPEAEFFDKIQTKVSRFSSMLFSYLYYSFALWFCFFKLTQPLTVSTVQLLYTAKEKGGKPNRKPHPLPPCGLRNPYRNLKSKNSQDYAQKPQRNCTFMNSGFRSRAVELGFPTLTVRDNCVRLQRLELCRSRQIFVCANSCES